MTPGVGHGTFFCTTVAAGARLKPVRLERRGLRGRPGPGCIRTRILNLKRCNIWGPATLQLRIRESNAQACWCLCNRLCFCGRYESLKIHPPRHDGYVLWFVVFKDPFIVNYFPSFRFRAVLASGPASAPIKPSIMPCSWCEGIFELYLFENSLNIPGPFLFY